jgi:hypothetical protein
MTFWIAILAGVLFVWLATRMGFYETWVLFINTIVAIYVSIFLTPILRELVPPPGGADSYHVALCMILLAGGCFALLQGLSYVFLTGQFKIPFPRVFDIVLSGVVGFATGFLMLSFLGLVLTTTPLAEDQIVGIFGLGQEPQQPNRVCITECCDVIHSFAGFAETGNTTQSAVQKLLEVPKVSRRPSPKPADLNAPPPKPQPPKETPPHKSRRSTAYDVE